MSSSVNSDYNNDIHSWLEIERQISNIAKAGFTHIQWIHDWEGEYIYSPSEMFQVRDLLNGYGLKAHTIHATEGGVRSKKIDGKVFFNNRYRFTEIRKDYTSMNEYTRQAGVDLIRNRINLCSHIGATVMVLHMQLPYVMFEDNLLDKEDYYKQVCKSFDEIQSYAKAAGVRIALENLICTPKHHQEEEFDRMFNQYDSDFLGFCFDSGHATLQCKDDIAYFLEKYNDRLYATHLQDTNSIPYELLNDDTEILRHDRHWVPFAAESVIDWDKIAQLVAKAPLELPADFEVGIYGNTPEEEFAGLKDCQQKAETFDAMVKSCRNKI